MKKIIPGLLSMLLCLGMATGCDAVKEKLPDVELPGFLENILGKESASSEEDTASESTPDSSTPDDSSEETPALHEHEQDLKDVKEYLQGIVNEMSLESRKEFKLINSYAFFGETAKYDIAWSVNVEGVTIVEGETEDTVKIGEFEEDTPFVLTATITDPEGCHTTTATFDGVALKALSLVPELITNKPVVGTAYKLYVYQTTLAKDLYFTGKMAATYYFGTTENYEEGVDVYAEYIDDNSFNLYFMDGETKTYIGVREAWNSKNSYWTFNIVMDTTAPSSFTWDADLGSIITTVPCRSAEDNKNPDATEQPSTKTLYLGNYSNKDTISSSTIDKAPTSNVGGLATMVDKNSYTPAVKVAAEAEKLSVTTEFIGADTVELPTAGKNYSEVAISWAVTSGENVAIENNVLTITAPAEDTTAVITATLTCGEETATKEFVLTLKAGSGLPADGSTLTIDEVLALTYTGDTTNKYYVTGTVKEVYNTTYGNMYITDEDGTELTVYGTYSADGTLRFDAMEASAQPKAGDIVKFYSILSSYSGKNQLKNAWIIEVTPGQGGSEGGNEGEEPDAPVGGEEVEINGEKVVIADYAAANSWVNSTLYDTLTAENYTVSISATTPSSYGQNAGKYYTNGENWRMYQADTTSILVSAAEGKTIAYVKITYASEKTGVLTLNGANVASDEVVTVNASTITFGVGNTDATVTNGQVRITAIEVELVAEEAPATYTLTLMNGNPRMGGTMETFEYEEGAKLDLAPLTANGKTFLGWFAMDDNGEATVAAPETMPAEAVALFAVWEVTAYTVTFVNGEETTSVKFGVEYDFANGIEATVNELSYVLADNLIDGYKYEEAIPEAFELKDYTFTLVEIPAEHVCSYEAVVTEPTCTAAGYTTYTCADCGNSYTADEVDALGHKHEATVTAPTCTAAGYTTYTCACGDSYTADEVDALGHADNDGDYKCDDCSTKVLPEADSALTIAQALTIGKLYTKDTYTTNKYYLTGTITEVQNTTYGNVVIFDGSNTILVYGLYDTTGKIRYDALTYKPVVGDEITVYGIIGFYTAAQMKNGWIDEVIAHDHNYSSVVTAPTCTVDGYTTETCSICNASTVKDVVAAPGHTTEAGTCERCGIEVGGESTEPVVVATFDFGTNGSAAHVDGNSLGASKSYTVGTYSLALTGMEKVYGPAYDAKGNSCIKFGTSSVVGKMSFTVPSDVNKVVIYVAKYKANTSKITVNGTAYTLTKNSNDGAYDAIEVDTTTTKTVSFATASGGVRCMINTIEFWA